MKEKIELLLATYVLIHERDDIIINISDPEHVYYSEFGNENERERDIKEEQELKDILVKKYQDIYEQIKL